MHACKLMVCVCVCVCAAHAPYETRYVGYLTCRRWSQLLNRTTNALSLSVHMRCTPSRCLWTKKPCL